MVSRPNLTAVDAWLFNATNRIIILYALAYVSGLGSILSMLIRGGSQPTFVEFTLITLCLGLYLHLAMATSTVPGS